MRTSQIPLHNYDFGNCYVEIYRHPVIFGRECNSCQREGIGIDTFIKFKDDD